MSASNPSVHRPGDVRDVRDAPSSELSLHPGWRRTFRQGGMTLGFFFPIEAYEGDRPRLENPQLLARRADEAGYAALWVRDVPLRDPHFGDVGQMIDPWVFASWIAAHTTDIAIGTGSVILPLRPAVDLAKASASLDFISGGRFLFGTATGDRPSEFPLYDKGHAERGAVFRKTLEAISGLYRNAGPLDLAKQLSGVPLELLPAAPAGRVPVLVTGYAQQTIEWIAKQADGWMTYPRDFAAQSHLLSKWNTAVGEACGPQAWKPVMQSLYLDLLPEPDAAPRPMHLGFRLGRNALIALLSRYQAIGIAHTAFNLKYSSRSAASVMDELTEYVLPNFRIDNDRFSQR